MLAGGVYTYRDVPCSPLRRLLQKAPVRPGTCSVDSRQTRRCTLTVVCGTCQGLLRTKDAGHCKKQHCNASQHGGHETADIVWSQVSFPAPSCECCLESVCCQLRSTGGQARAPADDSYPRYDSRKTRPSCHSTCGHMSKQQRPEATPRVSRHSEIRTPSCYSASQLLAPKPVRSSLSKTVSDIESTGVNVCMTTDKCSVAVVARRHPGTNVGGRGSRAEMLIPSLQQLDIACSTCHSDIYRRCRT